MKTIAVMCGGSSYEHEVSIITGIQVAEQLNYSRYNLAFVYLDKNNNIWWLPKFQTKKDFKSGKRVPAYFVREGDKVLLKASGLFGPSTSIDACYLGFHGGTGESGPIQGMLEMLDLPFTSASQEGSVISMNKSLTKEVLRQYDVPVLPSISVISSEYETNKQDYLAEIKQTFTLPVIIKPVHLGSSIAIEIAHTDVELEKYLNVATKVDNEVLVEPALQDFVEYNLSVRTENGAIKLSPIEEPIREDEILSFDDKYANGSKKTGGKVAGGGMELLDRKLPAQINDQLKNTINDLAVKSYHAARLAGLVRIDFMYSDEKLYCTEINPIPGSMAFYLWEATGEQFQEQVTSCIEDAFWRHEQRIKIEPYETDIVDKFIGA